MSSIAPLNAFNAVAATAPVRPRFGSLDMSAPDSKGGWRPFMVPTDGEDYFTSLCATRNALQSESLSKDYPPSQTFTVTHPGTQRTLHLRQWARRGETVAEQPDQAPVVLLIHGLGGRAEWQAPLAEKILDAQNCSSPRALVYSLHLPRTAKTAYAEGKIDNIQDLVNEVYEAVDYLNARHGNKVYAVGTSLGGLLLTDIAANPPESLAGVSLISPAYKPISTKGDKAQLAAAKVLKRAGLLERLSSRIKRHDTPERKAEAENIPEGLNPLQRRIVEEKLALGKFDLTPDSYLQVVDLMKKARKDLVKNIHLPVQVFISEKDTVVDAEAMKEAAREMPNQPFKDTFIYEDGEHDLICSARLSEMAAEINDRISGVLYAQD